MAFLVGDNTTQSGIGGPGAANRVGFACGGFIGAATGTAATAYIRIQAVNLATAVKVVVYSAAGAIIGTATITSLAAGWIFAALDAGVAIVSGTRYELGYVCTGGEASVYCDASSWNMAYDDTGTYASPPATISPRDDGSGDFNMGKPSIYLDGSIGGGASFPVPVLGVQRHRATAKRLGLFV